MDDVKKQIAEAFQELAKDSVHPSAEEIGAALEGVASEFASAEVRAHLGWCDACRPVAEEFHGFQRSDEGVEDGAWKSMRARLPVTAVRPTRNEWRWLPMAAALAVIAGPVVTWRVANNRPPRVEERIVTREVSAPVRVANAAVVDLYPEGDRTRGGGSTAAKVPATADLATFILNGAVVDVSFGFEHLEHAVRAALGQP